MAGEAPTVPFWQNKYQCEDAHNNYMEKLAGSAPQHNSPLVNQIAQAKQHVQNALKNDTVGGAVDSGVLSRLVDVEQDNKNLKKVTGDLQCLVKKLEQRLAALELGSKPGAPAKVAAPAKMEVDEDEDDFELFGSEDEEDDAAAEKLKEERLAAYAQKKSTKTAIIAKSSLLLDVKPWDDETDMKKMEELVRSISMEGLVWGASKLVPVGYGIRKLQICAVIVDDLISTDDLEEKITAFEDYVQSMDIAAFNKI